MAVFLTNSCKFKGCGLTFATLAELIQHIEETHIDTDPRVLELQELKPPTSLALSYVLRFYVGGGIRKQVSPIDHKKCRPYRAQSLSPVSSLRSATPTGSEFDEEELHSSGDESNDSWTAPNNFSTELILSMVRNRACTGIGRDVDKPFTCPVPGCDKQYKNINGMKYHAKHGHCKDRFKKNYTCQCGKDYKTMSGLRNHNLTQHGHSSRELLEMISPKRSHPIVNIASSVLPPTGTVMSDPGGLLTFTTPVTVVDIAPSGIITGITHRNTDVLSGHCPPSARVITKATAGVMTFGATDKNIVTSSLEEIVDVEDVYTDLDDMVGENMDM